MAADPQSVVPMDVLVAVIAIVNVVVQSLTQVVAHFIAKSTTPPDSPNRAILEEILATLEASNETRGAETHMVQDLYDMHKVTDGDGRPIWYFPGSIGKLIEQVSKSQADTARILEQLVRQFERRGRG